MQKFHGDKSKIFDPLSHMDLLSNLDESDYPVFCGVGSAFAEGYLIDAPIPVQEILYSCFIVENNDIELNMYWLECIHMFRTNGNSPLKKIESDPKVMELQLRMQMDQKGAKSQVEWTNREKKLLSMLNMTCENKHMHDTACSAGGSKKRDATSSLKTSQASTVKPTKSDTSTANSGASSASSTDLSPKSSSLSREQAEIYSAIEKITKKSGKCDESSPSTAKPKATATVTTTVATDEDEQLADVLKIAVKQKLNQ